MKILLINSLYFVYRILNLAVWIYVILSWIGPMHPTLSKAYYKLREWLEPMLAPIRKLLMPVTMRIGLDFSPYVLALLLTLVYRVLANIIIRI